MGTSSINEFHTTQMYSLIKKLGLYFLRPDIHKSKIRFLWPNYRCALRRGDLSTFCHLEKVLCLLFQKVNKTGFVHMGKGKCDT